MSQMTRPFRDLCSEADLRDAMTDAEFWAHVFPQDGPCMDDYEDDTESEISRVTPCVVCGSTVECGYDAEGRPMFHCDAEGSE